jgi:hypothetical protein
MSRINVYYRDPQGSQGSLLGWFDDEKLEEVIKEDTEWDGNNWRGKMSGLQCGHESLYRTSGGRWVRHYDARREYNGPEFYEFLTAEQAREWLLRAEEDKIVEKYFGKLEEEAGPGRPEIGGAVHVRLGEELARVDAWAKEHKVKRAEAVRRLVAVGLDAVASAAAV